MNKEIFQTLIAEGQEEIASVELNERSFEFEDEGRYVLVGIRQAGKSYLLYQRARQLMKAGHSVKEIVYINFDDERLIGMKSEDFDLILQAYHSRSASQPILFFDEIQNIDGWEHFARRLANQKYKVFITGSNAKMLSRDIATTLGGRFFDEWVYPYSFAEYLNAKGITLDNHWDLGRSRDTIRLAYSDYFTWGGFPELLLYKNKRHWLNGLYEKIVLGDIIQRNRIKNEIAIRLAIKRLAENNRQPIAYNRLATMVKSTGVSTNTASIIDYVQFAKEACLLFTLDNFASKFTERETVKKHYFMDNGLLNIFLTDSHAALLENLCAVCLYRKYHEKLCFYNRNIEVDFYVEEEGLAVQASYSLNDENTFNREVEALIKLNAAFPLRRMMIITYDEERHIELTGDKVIEVLPAWKWMLTDF